jgi:hypothetical protein
MNDWKAFWQDVAAGKADEWECMWHRGDAWLPVTGHLSSLYLCPHNYTLRRKRCMVTVTIPRPLKKVPEHGAVWTWGSRVGVFITPVPHTAVATGRGFATEEEAQMAHDAFRALVEGE